MAFPIFDRKGKSKYLLLMASAGIPPVISFVMMPLIAANVTPLEYGNYIAYQSMCAVLTILVGFSSAGYISNAFIEPRAASKIASSLLLVSILTVPLVACVAFILNYNFQGYPIQIVSAMLLTGLLTFIVTCFQAYTILLKRYGYLLALAVVQFLPQALLISYFVVNAGLSFERLVLSSIVGLLLAAILCLTRVRAKLALHFVHPSMASIKSIVIYGLPLMPHLLLSLATGSFDRWLLAKTDNIHFLAVYAVALSAAAPMYILLDVGNKVYSPFVFERLRDGERNFSKFWHLVAGFNAFSMLAALVGGVLGFFFVRQFFGLEYQAAALLCGPLCFAIGAFSLYYSASPFLYYFNETKLILLASVIGAITTGLVSTTTFPVLDGAGLILGKLLGFLASGVVALIFAFQLLKNKEKR